MPDRTKAPESSVIDLPNLPALQTVHLPCGLDLHLLNQGQQPVVLFEMVVPLGRWEEPSAGLAYYLFKMLTEGTPTKSSEEIASFFDFYGSHLEITPTLDAVNIKLYALNKFFPELVKFLTDLLTESSFPKREFETLKQIRIEQIRQQYSRNNAFASLKFRELLFGAEHPYGLMISEEQARKTQRDDLLNHKNLLCTQPLLFITGMVGEDEIKAVESAFEGFPQTPTPSKRTAFTNTGKSQTITREDSTQASLRIGKTTINRHHEDIHKLKVANELLGGFFGSRLMKNIREEKGLTYGIHSSFLHLHHASYWCIGSELLRDKVTLGQEEIQKEITKLQQSPPEQEEFSMVINYMKGKFLSSFDSPFSAHGLIKSLKLAQLPESYFMDFFDTLQNIKPEDISLMASRHFNQDDITTLVVV
ncbi:M16 family metallopeptidase [Marinoscillum furvescens]|uniref:Putative Zn-dependent peptidase n=1 Tax=Marinoscillum furvescens DSM 4134 TaxID=1122208 RepID=A0A3D9L536_MARFU|nr:pitrilysin family protein [Marinoscillum furvescens]RED99739.1 putative Zn-dependent peptidase [Marinoscillum furvescens DSM 4134]